MIEFNDNRRKFFEIIVSAKDKVNKSGGIVASFLVLFLMGAYIPASSAFEMSAKGDSTSGIKLEHLSNRLDSLSGMLLEIMNRLDEIELVQSEFEDRIDEMSTEVNNISAANKNGLFYNPKHESADENGFFSPVDSSNTKIVHESICRRGGIHKVEVTCPTGYALNGCSGGPGDLFESHEGSFIRPIPAKNLCELTVGNPACVRREPWTYSHVYAFCIKR